MGRFVIEGGRKLGGRMRVQGAKNSALPILAATVAVGRPCVIHNCPSLTDIDSTLGILKALGCEVHRSGDSVSVDSSRMTLTDIPDDLMREMRSSIIFLGALISRTGEARLCAPGGCDIGMRPIDLHLFAMEKLGVVLSEEYGHISCKCARTKGAKITLSFPSVGATENLILAALGCRGTLTLCNAAREPEIEDLAGYLNRCGAHIHGAGESCIVIEGVPHLYGSTYTVMPDRIAAATYMAAAAVTGGTVLLRDVNSEHLLPVLSAFESTGCAVMQSGSELLLRAPQRLKPVRHVRTMPYPGFPTDAQAPVMTMAAVGDGTSIFVENIFESRYKHAGELNRLGAKIKLEGKVAVIEGVPQLSGAPVSAEDLRGGAALVIAGLAAQGETQVMHPQYIDRGYAHFEENLRALGADVYRI